MAKGFWKYATINKNRYDRIKLLMGFDQKYKSFVYESYNGKSGLRGLNNSYKALEKIYKNIITTNTYVSFKQFQRSNSSQEIQCKKSSLQQEVSTQNERFEQEIKLPNRPTHISNARTRSDGERDLFERILYSNTIPTESESQSDWECRFNDTIEKLTNGEITDAREANRIIDEFERERKERHERILRECAERNEEIAREHAQRNEEIAREHAQRNEEIAREHAEIERARIERCAREQANEWHKRTMEQVEHDLELFSYTIIEDFINENDEYEALGLGHNHCINRVMQVYKFINEIPYDNRNDNEHAIFNEISEWYASHRDEIQANKYKTIQLNPSH